MKKRMLTRWLLLAVGFLSVGLGVIGMFVPLLPTTPFLLLAAACFARSSQKWTNWLLGHRWLGPIIRHYRAHHAIAAPVRIVSLLMLWSTIGYAVLAVVDHVTIRVLLIVIAACVTVHLVRLKTLTPEMLSAGEGRPEEQEKELV